MRRFRIVPVLAICLLGLPLLAAEDLVKWRSIPEGEAEATKTGKPVLYFMTADWCSPCREMKKEVFSDPNVARLVNGTFVPIEVVDRSREEGRNAPEVERLMSRYRIRGFPTLTVTRPGSLVGYQAPGWSSRAATVEYLEGANAKFLQMEKRARESEGKR